MVCAHTSCTIPNSARFLLCRESCVQGTRTHGVQNCTELASWLFICFSIMCLCQRSSMAKKMRASHIQGNPATNLPSSYQRLNLPTPPQSQRLAAHINYTPNMRLEFQVRTFSDTTASIVEHRVLYAYCIHLNTAAIYHSRHWRTTLHHLYAYMHALCMLCKLITSCSSQITCGCIPSGSWHYYAHVCWNFHWHSTRRRRRHGAIGVPGLDG